MKTYNDLNSLLTGRYKDSKKIDNNTYAERKPNGSIAIRLHETDVLTYLPTGVIIYDTGGYYTATTKARLNKYAPVGVYQKKREWYFEDDSTFHDGSVYYDGAVYSSEDELLTACGGQIRTDIEQ